MSIAAVCALLVLPAQVELRSGRVVPQDAILAVDAEGVTIGAPGGDPSGSTIMGWQIVLDVEGDWSDEAETHAQLAEDVWRASARLERGDSFAAEPIFERLLQQVSGRAGPTSAIIAEGVLRCRLRRGAHAGALTPWLDSARIAEARRASPRSWRKADPPEQWTSPIDPDTLLCPSLPPIWHDSAAVRALASSESGSLSNAGLSTSEQLRSLFVLAARHETGQAVTLTPETLSPHPGVSLVRDMVQAQVGEGVEDRRLARTRLSGRLGQNTPRWEEAWRRAAIGRSLIREEGIEDRMLGVIELLHLPARFGESHPYLAGIALWDSSLAMKEMGDPVGAARLLDELKRSYPDHPVLAEAREAGLLADLLPSPR